MNAGSTRKTNRMGTAAARATRRVRLLAVGLVAVLTGFAALPAAAQTTPTLPAGCTDGGTHTNHFSALSSTDTAVTGTFGEGLTGQTGVAVRINICKPGMNGTYSTERALNFTVAPLPVSGDTFEITGLTADTDYWVRALVYNRSGAWHHIRTAPTVPAGCPAGGSAPSGLKAVASTSTTITVTFASLVSTYAGELLICEPDASDVYSGRTVETYLSGSHPAEDDTHEITGLTPDKDYWVQMNYANSPPWHYIRTAAAGGTGPAITIAAGTSPVTEGTAAEFTVTADSAPSADLTVNLTVADASGSDFVAAGDEGSKTVTIAANTTTATHSVATVADTTDEPDGNVTVTVGNGTGYTVGSTASAMVTVNDDDGAGTLVSNTGQSQDATSLIAIDRAQAFTTGSHNGGYKLTSVDVPFSSVPNVGVYTITIETSNPSNRPGDSLGTLSHETTSTNTRRHSAPGNGIDLDPDTTYFVVHRSTSGASASYRRTNSDAEDSGGAAGWSLGDGSLWDNSGWDTSDTSWQIAINGSEKPEPTLVSNTGQTLRSADGIVGSTGAAIWSAANTFTAGSSGATLSEVDVRLGASGVGSAATPRVSLYSTTSGAPDSSLFVFDNPGSFAASAVNTFTVPTSAGAAATLTAGTMYAIVLETTSSSTGTDNQIHVATTASGDEDSGGQSGWSIGDDLHQRQGTGAWNLSGSAIAYSIALRGALTASGPAITIAAGTSPVTEGTAAEFTVTADSAPSADLTVNLTVADASGSDFVAAGDEGAQTVTITANTTTATHSVPTTADSTDEADGNVTVTVGTGTGYTVGSTASASVMVNDDDATAPTAPCAATSGQPGFFGSDFLTLTATASTIELSYTNKSSTSHKFQLCKSGNSTIDSETATGHLTAHTFSSLDADTDYWVRVVEASADPTDWHHIRTKAAGSDPTITIAAGTSPVAEGTAAQFTVTADSAPSADLTVNLTVADASGSDFVAAGDEGSKTVTITANTTTATHSVPTTDDSTDEPNGNVTVTVNSGTGYTVGSTASASVTVNNDEDAAVGGPNSPQNVSVEAANYLDLIVRWEAPTSLPANHAVTGYTVEWTGDGATETAEVGSDSRERYINKLTEGAGYTARVAAKITDSTDAANPVDSTAWSGATAPATIWQETVQGWFGDGTPNFNAQLGRVFFRSNVNVIGGSAECSFKRIVGSGDDGTGTINCPPTTLVSLDASQGAGHVFEFSVTAWIGASELAEATNLSTTTFEGQVRGPAQATGGFGLNAATRAVASGGNGRLVVGWTGMSSFAATGTVDAVVVETRRQNNDGTWPAWTQTVIEGVLDPDSDDDVTTGSHTLANQPFGTYQVRVRARADGDDGDANTTDVPRLGVTSATRTVTVAAANTNAPGSPTDVTVTPASGGTTRKVTWEPPTDAESGAAVYGYKVRHREQGSGDDAWTESDELYTAPFRRFCASSGDPVVTYACENPRTYEITGLTDGTEYEVEVLALNANSGLPDDTVLVSNLGQDDDGAAAFANDLAQPFTTGSNTAGYTLTSVEVEGKSTGTAPTYTAAIHQDSSSAPGTKVGDLSAPALTGSDAAIEFTAAGDGLDLDAATTYWLVIDNSTETTDATIKRTSATAEDDGAAAGWSIGDTRLFRAFGDTTWSSHTQPLKISVHGSAKVADPPTFSRATVDVAKLTIVFNRDLDMTSEPAPAAFGVTVAGAGRTVTSVGVFDNQVALTLSSAVSAGQSVTVTYTKPASNPLRDAGGEVATFGAQSVRNRTPASAPSGRLVSNTGQVTSSTLTFSTSGVDAQGFTTGSHVGGYTLTSVGLGVNVLSYFNTQEPVYTVSIWSSDSSGNPDSNLGTLTNPALLGTGINYFTASTGIDLAASTTYFVVLAATSIGDVDPQINYTASDNEDAGGAAGWTIANGLVVRPNAGTWQPSTLNIKLPIAIHGSAKPADSTAPTFAGAVVDEKTVTLTFNEDLDANSLPAPGDFTVTVGGTRHHVATGGVAIEGNTVTLTLVSAPNRGETVTVGYTLGDNPLQDAAGNPVDLPGGSSVANETGIVALVSNTGQAKNSAGNAGNDHAQAFTTGSSGEGYKLTRVGVRFTVSDADAHTDWAVELWSDSGTAPDTMLHALDKPVALSTGVNWFTAPGPGIDLAPDTSYWVVWDNDSHGGNNLFIDNTTSVAEDSDGAAGWSIADTSRFRRFDASDWIDFNPIRMISLRGYAVDDTSPPDFVSAAVNGSTLTVTFDESLDTTSVPDPDDFHVTVGSRRDVVDGGVAIAGDTVTLTLESAVGPNDTVRVRYAAGTNPLRDTAGNAVATFGNQTVTNNSPEPLLPEAVVKDVKLTLIYDADLDLGSVPAAGDFQVTVNDQAQELAEPVTADPGADPPVEAVVPVAIRDTRVVLTLNALASVGAGDRVTVTYPTNPTGAMTPILGADGREAARFTDRSVRNLASDTAAPTLRSVTADTTDPLNPRTDKLVLSYSELLEPDFLPQASEFWVEVVGDGRITVTDVAVSGRRVVLTLASTVAAGDEVWVTYNGTALADYAGNPAGRLTKRSVTHGAPPEDQPSTGGGTPGDGGGGGGGETPGGGGGGGGGTPGGGGGDPETPEEPSVSVAAVGESVTEGGAARFAVTASPGPEEALEVRLAVSGGAAWGVADGARTVTIAADATRATLRLATVDDEEDEPDGALAVELRPGDGYAVDADARRATVAVLDDDAPANTAPTVAETIPDVVLEADDPPLRLDLAAFFADAEDETLSYAAAPADAPPLRIGIADGVLTLTPSGDPEGGAVEVTVTATDSGGLRAAQTFTAAVAPPVRTTWRPWRLQVLVEADAADEDEDAEAGAASAGAGDTED